MGRNQGSSLATIEKHCEWILRKLLTDKNVTKDEFTTHFLALSKQAGKTKTNWNPDWSRAKHATSACLRTLSIEFDGSKDNEITLLAVFEGVTVSSGSFRPDIDFAFKQKIGQMLATFLKGKRTSVFLGSGSTVFHIANAMKKNGQYKQLFWTVNIALAAALCGMDDPPVSKISIPEAVLETHSFRFATMQEPGWAPAMVIVGADGWRFDTEKSEVYFYGNEQSVADNTNLFVKNATHSVIYCLDSSKIQAGLDPYPNSGPRIHSPRKGVLRILVTNEEPPGQVQEYFKNDGWIIVADEADWANVEEKLQHMETAAKKGTKTAVTASARTRASKNVEVTIVN
jgi:hypothetical protein